MDLEREIEPYEQTLNNMRTKEIKEWASHVLQQLESVSTLQDTEFVFLAGDKYRRYLLPAVKYAKVPLEGLRIGEQLKKLKELTS